MEPIEPKATAVAKEAVVIAIHPRMVARWATRYIMLYRSQGSDVAKKWALEFLGPGERQAMIEKVNKILHRGKKTDV